VPLAALLHEGLVFAAKQLRSCVFAGAFFAVLVLSNRVHVPGLARYDLILVASLAIQALLVATRMESWDEVKVLCVFHALGLGLELFKTQSSIGSWSYPEPGLAKIAGVPLYSGFMYAAVASYLCQAWRVLKLELIEYPDPRASLLLALAIYANFFTHHFMADLRWPLTAAVVWLFRRTYLGWDAVGVRRRMPLVLAFVIIGFFIWVAENAATLHGAWAYPDQRMGWRAVSLGKIHCWALLVILSFVLVADLKWLKARLPGGALSPRRSRRG
jgi:uncharacterized membrane protein YoaT (DUF817 family)